MRIYTVIITHKAQHALNRLHTPDIPRILATIDTLKTNPRPPGSRKLAGIPANEPSQWRVRVGDYRILYTINDNTITITIIRIAPRSRAYND
ncbi:MAG: type II toxin-antitoxin system RelE/ParE family toxin [Propionibacteriaceae bacterium]|nr:type II toxin-antitoxin system RelE/ParE family toxin [Propionibacteriaceae bacterium]